MFFFQNYIYGFVHFAHKRPLRIVHVYCLAISEINIDDKNIQIYGSQGQKKSAILSLKICELEIVKEELNENPLKISITEMTGIIIFAIFSKRLMGNMSVGGIKG